jgi:hypothetical protein
MTKGRAEYAFRFAAVGRVVSPVAELHPLLSTVQHSAVMYHAVLLPCAVCRMLCAVCPTGLGMVRRICLAPASPPVLSGTTEAALSGAATARGSGVERMRAAVLFAGGQVGGTPALCVINGKHVQS